MGERIVIAGASGFIGRYLAEHYRAQGATVRLIGRSGADVRWDDAAGIRAAVSGADLVINLAGKSVNCRYGDAERAEIFRSRLETTRALREAIAASDAPPPLWFNASTATIYRHAEDRPMTESTGELGTGFSVNVAKAWEREFLDKLELAYRVIDVAAGDLGSSAARKFDIEPGSPSKGTFGRLT